MNGKHVRRLLGALVLILLVWAILDYDGPVTTNRGDQVEVQP